jgi:hypothetical protein
MNMDNPQEIKVKVVEQSDPQIRRAFEIMQARIQQRCAATVCQVEDGAQIVLEICAQLPAEAFRIEARENAVHIAGGSPRGLLYGIGKFLHTSAYSDSFQASAWRGTSVPQSELRGMYFASHFHNWYHEAPDEEITRYVEDLALWGVNAVSMCFPFIDLTGWDNPEAGEAVAMLRRFARIVKEAGLMYGLMIGNTLFSGVPQSIRAVPLADPTGRRGNSGNPICPSKPDGREFLLDAYRKLYEYVADIGVDFIVHWPYDEGGCTCQDCQPWGSNGFLKVSHDLTSLGKEFFPGLKSILSTWMFDTPPEGEWQGLSEILSTENQWVDGILADSHEDYPRYPLEEGVPGGLPLYNFPEISMWGNWPWGGAGANPLPGRLQKLWNQVSGAVQGGLPYSEGIYEDVNKALVTQFYWDRQISARATLEEYIGYEFSPEATSDVLELISLFEDTASCSYQKQPIDPQKVDRAYQIAEQVRMRLPVWALQNWRWELLHLRAVIDRERFNRGGLETPEAESAMMQLIKIYHCQLETDDPYHHRVRPPLRRAISRRGAY